MPAFPSRDKIGNALLALLYLTGGDYYQLRSSDTHGPLADTLRIGDTERRLVQDEYYPKGSSAELVWPNKVRLARWDLVDAGLVDGSERGIWRLTPKGIAVAKVLLRIPDEVAAIMKRLKANVGSQRRPTMSIATELRDAGAK